MLPVFLANPITGTVSPRPGASVVLSSAFGSTSTASLSSPFTPADTVVNGSDVQAAGGGSVLIGAGATVRVDPKSTILVQGFDQVTVDGTLAAPGGAISVLNDRLDIGFSMPEFVEGQSVFIGSDAVLDVAAQPFVTQDRQGRPFGVVPAGGSITLGGNGQLDAEQSAITTDAAVIIQPGAVLDASGTSAMIDPLAGTSSTAADGLSVATDPSLPVGPTLVASAGGSITAGVGDRVVHRRHAACRIGRPRRRWRHAEPDAGNAGLPGYHRPEYRSHERHPRGAARSARTGHQPGCPARPVPGQPDAGGTRRRS